ncbi:alanyl-tRNA editing protein [Hespellia stercorisuis]|uniref:Alanyl-tRNA synthetase n=1 Tax=Hespellia stercorisuis DSM 15480 TaxID=1121950 RepID=A0A1M6N1Z2_9FIRM|nr:alanyl-tRNA editing protein [Hespellia stercorisuis]SHJ89759.1 alanyl-tRNA synthetase [Hespellia stercorisuis DSM 15480]
MILSKTRKLYDADAYQTSFDAAVISCEEKKSKKDVTYQIVLDQTLFFPEEGGQSADRGVLNGIDVLDVQIKNEIITHTLSERIEPGQNVHGEIDWEHRFNNMQQHTGEHIFSGLVHAKFGYDNVGFHLSDQVVTMDFSGVLTEEDAREIEHEVNLCIAKNIPVEISFPEKDILTKLDYRSKIEIDGAVRIVTIPGYDVCACCAPHVQATGAIGSLKVQSIQNYKGGVRISILCGLRALSDYRQKLAAVKNLSNMLSVPQEEVVTAVEKLQNDMTSLKVQLKKMQQERILEKVRTLPQEYENVCLLECELDPEVMRTAVNEMMNHHSGYCAALSGSDEDGYRFVIGSKAQDAKILAQQLREEFQAKGGGSSDMIQGQVHAPAEAIKSWILQQE